MIIGYDAKRAFHNLTGLGEYSRNLITALSKTHPEVMCKLYSKAGGPEELLQWSPGSNTERIGPTGLYQSMATTWRRRGLAKQSLKDKVQLFHGLSHELPRGLNKQGVKAVVTMHDVIGLRKPAWYPWIDRKVYRQKMKHACKTADRVLAISQQTATELVEEFPDAKNKVQVQYQSCHPMMGAELTQQVRNFMIATYNLHNRFILCVGSISERKNQNSLLRAYQLLLEKMPDVDLVFVGDGKEAKDQLLATVHRDNLLGRVQLIPYCNTQRLAALYQLADVTAYVSHYEGFGIPIIESLQSNTPVVASQGGCFAEAGGPGAEYVDPNDAISMADGLFKVLNDPLHAGKLTKQGAQHIAQFAPSHVANQVLHHYQDVLAT